MNSQAPFKFQPPVPAEPASRGVAGWIGLVEGAVLIGGVFAFERLGIFDLHALPLHPFVLVIALLAAQYGSLAGVTAALAATALTLLGGTMTERVVGEEYFQYLAQMWSAPLAWLLVAVVVGMVVDRHRRALSTAESNLSGMGQERDLIATQYESLQTRAKRLERIAAGFETASRRSS